MNKGMAQGAWGVEERHRELSEEKPLTAVFRNWASFSSIGMKLSHFTSEDVEIFS